MNLKVRNSLILVLVSFIWGMGFVAQSEAGGHLGTLTFNGVRFLIAALVLLPFIRLGGQRQGRGLWRAGLICGLLLFTANYFQQEGIAQGTGAGKAGFLTAIYILMVPIFNLLFFKRKTPPTVWLGVILALAGTYLLCITGNLSYNYSDLLVLVSAALFAFHILAVDRFSPRYNPIELAVLQFFVCGAVSSLLMIPFEIVPVGLKAWAACFTAPGAWISLSYVAFFSCAIGYTLQIVGQRGLNPAVASLLMSLESLVAVLGGWLILHQTLSSREIAGAVLVFIAVILAQLPARQKAEKR
ncbi:MAG: DMT family transporter [Bacteroidales bacterium]|nr:DMT family transporter [Bacteroidales bacterium]